MTTYTDMIPSDRIFPPHNVRDDAKLQSLVDSMERDGWTGRPILVLDDGNGYHGWTGSHRIAAARELGLEIPVVVMEPPSVESWEATGLGDELFGDCRDDYDRLYQLSELDGYQEAAQLMTTEVEQN